MNLTPELVRSLAHDEGFDLVRFGPAHPGEHAARLEAWLDEGMHGSMSWLADWREKLVDPARWARDPKSAICLAADYGGPPVDLAGGGRIARYAAGRDYHRALGDRVRRLRRRLEREGVPHGSIDIGTDAIPILERALAVRSGVGFLAKSAGVISPDLGPYLLLSELLVPFELPFDLPSPGSCGTCTRCIDACPTGAILAPYRVDARRCISYTTIELRGSIPDELREPQGSWVFGCDVCLEVCPFASTRGRAATPGAPRPDAFLPHPVVEHATLVGLVELDEADYEERWVGTALRRATRTGLRRNAAVALGNLGDQDALPALRRGLADVDGIVREHCAWAIGRIAPRDTSLDAALARETDDAARRAIATALARR
ncbi:MAG: tRNA epoxyqueuosine(34) reductase QueG [Planctomycetes bacterium]|nr:tRNA epoxyqueuosine(34) reductase QueG [Planctomycetota bacterium]